MMLVSNKTSLTLAFLSISVISVNAQSTSDIQPSVRIGWGGDLAKAEKISYDEIKPANPYNHRSINNYRTENNNNTSYKSTSNNLYNNKSYTTGSSNTYNKIDTSTTNLYNNKSYNTNNYSSSDTDTYENNSKAYRKSYTNSYKPKTYGKSYQAKTYPSNSYNNYSTTYNSSHNNYYNKFSKYSNSYNSYEKLAISTGSRGVMVYDLQTGKALYQKNANIARPIASVTKLMTAMVVLDARQNMNEKIQLEAQDFRCVHVTCKKSSSRLKVGDRLPRKDWLLMMLMKSENPAAKTLARHYPGGYRAFMRAINRKARSLGMYNTFFGDPSGLDKRNKSSPADLVKMVKAARKYRKIRQYSTTPSHNFYMAGYSPRTYRGRSTSYLVRNKTYPITLSKTGYIRNKDFRRG